MRGARPTPKSPCSQSASSKSAGSSKRSPAAGLEVGHPVEEERAGDGAVDVVRHAGDAPPWRTSA